MCVVCLTAGVGAARKSGTPQWGGEGLSHSRVCVCFVEKKKKGKIPFFARCLYTSSEKRHTL